LAALVEGLRGAVGLIGPRWAGSLRDPGRSPRAGSPAPRHPRRQRRLGPV